MQNSHKNACWNTYWNRLEICRSLQLWMLRIGFSRTSLERQEKAHAIEVSLLLGNPTSQMPHISYRYQESTSTRHHRFASRTKMYVYVYKIHIDVCTYMHITIPYGEIIMCICIRGCIGSYMLLHLVPSTICMSTVKYGICFLNTCGNSAMT
jgi:hypothetical protein